VGNLIVNAGILMKGPSVVYDANCAVERMDRKDDLVHGTTHLTQQNLLDSSDI